ncbi:MAG: RNA 2',3'-cyclic phosphodiesterase [Proteobacteria bacterium]|nr:RNA 2',3'-cyclic phosphodiesterase [Pseudomonadota bacterium]
MNIFLGLPLPEEFRHLLIDFLLQKHPSWKDHRDIRWTLPASHHITLHFFGAVAVLDLKDLITALADSLLNFPSFQVAMTKIDNFPEKKSNLVASYTRLSANLAQLYHLIEQTVAQHHFPKEQRPYLPHVTLCRSRKNNLLTMEPIFLADILVPISSVILYQTQATAQGSVYHALAAWQLKSK